MSHLDAHWDHGGRPKKCILPAILPCAVFANTVVPYDTQYNAEHRPHVIRDTFFCLYVTLQHACCYRLVALIPLSGLAAALLQNPMQLMSDESITKSVGRHDLYKYELPTESSGTVHLNLGVILKEGKEMKKAGFSAIPEGNLLRRR